MKMFSHLKYTLAAAAMLLLGTQPDARGAFTLDSGFEGDEAIKNGHCFIDFIDGASQAFWIFKGSTPLYTVGITTTGGWITDEKVMRKDGSFVILW